MKVPFAFFVLSFVALFSVVAARASGVFDQDRHVAILRRTLSNAIHDGNLGGSTRRRSRILSLQQGRQNQSRRLGMMKKSSKMQKKKSPMNMMGGKYFNRMQNTKIRMQNMKLNSKQDKKSMKKKKGKSMKKKKSKSMKKKKEKKKTKVKLPRQPIVTAPPPIVTNSPTTSPRTSSPVANISAGTMAPSPTRSPVITASPTTAPSSQVMTIPRAPAPTVSPVTTSPTKAPNSSSPTKEPTVSPTSTPKAITLSSQHPTVSPSRELTDNVVETDAPTEEVTTRAADPTSSPTDSPSTKPTNSPTKTPTTLAPTKADDTSAPTNSPVTTKPTKAPVTTEPTKTDESTRPTTTPVTPVTPDPTDSPVTTEPTKAPVTAEPTKADETTSPTMSPVTPDPTTSPATPEPTEAPVTTEPTKTDETTRPTTTPVTPEPTKEPVTPEPTMAPVTLEPTALPVAEIEPVPEPPLLESPVPTRSPTSSPTETPSATQNASSTLGPSPPPSLAEDDDDEYYDDDDEYYDDDDEYYDDDDGFDGECPNLAVSTLEENDFSDYIDLTGDDYSPGDLYVYDENEMFADGFNDGGLSAGRCAALQDTEDGENLYCQISFIFDEGTIELAGVYFELAVVGGTGCFANAAGFMELGDPAEGDLAYDFVPEESAPDDCPNNNSETNWEQTVSVDFVDVDSDGDSVGDVFVFDSNDLESNQGTAGVVEGECMYVSDDDLYCTMTFVLGDNAESTLYTEGPLNNMIIVHGSGCYLGVTGTVSGEGSLVNGSTANYKFNFDNSNNQGSCFDGILDTPWVEASGDSFVDYDGDGEESNGELYVYNNKVVSLTHGSGSLPGFMTGRCFILQGEGYYCSYVANVPGGSVHFRGFWGDMTIIAGTGCYRDLTGSVSAEEGDNGYEYTFDYD